MTTTESSKEDTPQGLGALLEALSKSISETVIEDVPVIGLNPAPSAHTPEVGGMVKIRPCAAEYEDKTYLGLYIGSFAIGAALARNTVSGERKIVCQANPAFFVPALKKVIFGAESFWGKIKDEAELKSITDAEIDSLWYIQALKAVAEKKT